MHVDIHVIFFFFNHDNHLLFLIFTFSISSKINTKERKHKTYNILVSVKYTNFNIAFQFYTLFIPSVNLPELYMV